MQNLDHILNWRRLSDNITTSGQPTETQLADIAALSVTHVINLGPHSNKGALHDEPKSVRNLGMEYIYIPVDFENPTQKDFDEFCKALSNLTAQTIHVHCIYNARVSAFFYRHAKQIGGETVQTAFDRMEGIWRPGGVWATFIGDKDAIDLPNRFAGYDY